MQEIRKKQFSKATPIVKAMVTEKFYATALKLAKDCYLKQHNTIISNYLLESAFALGEKSVIKSINFINTNGILMDTKEGIEIARFLKQKEHHSLALMVPLYPCIKLTPFRCILKQRNLEY